MAETNAWVQDAINHGWWDSIEDLTAYRVDCQHDLDIEKKHPLAATADIRIGLIDAVNTLTERIVELMTQHIATISDEDLSKLRRESKIRQVRETAEHVLICRRNLRNASWKLFDLMRE